MPRAKKVAAITTTVTEVTEQNLLDAVVEQTLSTKVITVNREQLINNAYLKTYYPAEYIKRNKKGPVEIQVFVVGKETILIKAVEIDIQGSCKVKYDPSKFTAPKGCGSAITTPKAVWIETTGRVTYTDIEGDKHTI